MKSNTALRVLLMFVAFIVIGYRAFGQEASEDIVLTWNNVAVKTASSNNTRGLLMVRALAIMHTAMFDAWAQYDSVAAPTLGEPARRPVPERTVANKREAISYRISRSR